MCRLRDRRDPGLFRAQTASPSGRTGWRTASCSRPWLASPISRSGKWRRASAPASWSRNDSKRVARRRRCDGCAACGGRGVGLNVVQLAAARRHWLAQGARVAEAAGADIIDINMGCPAKRVTAGQAGAALLRDLDHATKLIETVKEAVRVPVTLKMRLGWDENSIVAPELARRAEAAGVAMITVHGRTRCQFYQGRADWSAIAREGAVSIPVVANGDLQSYQDARAMLEASGADAVMVGRAARGRPWFPGQVAAFLQSGERPADPPAEVQRDALLELHDAWLSHYGHLRGIREARKHTDGREALAISAGAPRLGKILARPPRHRDPPALVVRGIREPSTTWRGGRRHDRRCRHAREPGGIGPADAVLNAVAASGHHRRPGRHHRRCQCGGGNLSKSGRRSCAGTGSRSSCRRQPVADPTRPGAPARCGGQRIPGRSRHARTAASGSSNHVAPVPSGRIT